MTSPDETPTAPGARLERAVELFLGAAADGPAAMDRLMREHADLRDLLEPMLEGSADAPTPDDGAHETLGDYRLLDELGRGGMGVVYAAWQRSLDRRVAVKVLSPALVQEPSAIARLRREAAAAGRLRHPGIVEVYEFASAGQQHFFAMQLVDGPSLTACRERFAAPSAAVELTAQLADALAHAHAHGLVHRDVKPANVLVTADGRAVLTDFGVASDTTLPTLTQTGDFLGTLDYAAPEQLRGDRVDVRCDVWALGVVLFELLTGEHPFRAATRAATLRRVLEHEPTLRRVPGVSRDLAAIVSRALEKDPARRYRDAAAMHADLRALQRGAPITARLPGPLERTVRWGRREPWRALFAVCVAIAVPALAATLGYLAANQPRIAAATAAERQATREAMLAEAWWHCYEGDATDGLTAIASLPDDDEVAATRASLLLRLGDENAATKAVAGHDGPACVRLQQRLGGGREAAAARTDGDAFTAFLEASMLLHDAVVRGRGGNRGMLRDALAAARRAIATSPHPRLPYLLALAGIAESLDDAQAGAVARAALEQLFPDSHVGRRMRARSMLDEDPAAALALLDAEPAELARQTSLLRGLALERLDRLDEAVAAYRTAIELRPDDARAWTDLGLVLRKQKQPDAAIPALERATQLLPHDAFAWNALGLAQRDGRHVEAAAAAFERAMKERPDYSAPAYNLGNLRMRDGNTEGAIAALTHAAKCDDANARTFANLGDALLRAGRGAEALPQFVRASELAPNELIPAYNLARTALNLGLPTLALPAAERAAALDKRGFHGSWVLADALLAQQPVDAARALAAAQLANERVAADEPGVKETLTRAQQAAGAPR
ncbi:MAG: protein kinase [Planctomycetes bacterium]|nr:protein kinase [Planctomycetota bacterium]